MDIGLENIWQWKNRKNLNSHHVPLENLHWTIVLVLTKVYLVSKYRSTLLGLDCGQLRVAKVAAGALTDQG